MAILPKVAAKPVADDSSIPNRIVIDFLEGTLRKKDAIAFARGFVEHHFESLTASGYYVMPYEQGFIFEAQEGGPQRAYLPGIMKALDEDPAASACVQMARRIMEVKRSQSGTYTAVLLPESTESQNEDIVFPTPGPRLIPFQRSGLSILYTGLSIAAIGLIVFILSVLFWLVEVTGLMSPTLRTINLSSLPLTQWQSLMNAGGEKSDSYVKTLRYQDNNWQEDKVARQQFAAPASSGTGSAPDLAGLPPGVQPVTGQSAATTPAPASPAVIAPAAGSAAAPRTPTMPNPLPSLPGNPMPNHPMPGNAPPGTPTAAPRPQPGPSLPGNPTTALPH